MSGKRSTDSRKRSSRPDTNITVTSASFQGLSLGSPTSSNPYSTSTYTNLSTSAFDYPFDTSDLDLTSMSYYPDIPHSSAPRGYPSTSQGYPYRVSETSLSRSTSGPLSQVLPSDILPSSTYGEFREAGQEIARRRRRHHAQGRRDHKTRTRRAAMLLSGDEDPGSSQADFMSGPIDSFAAQTAQSYGGGSSPYAHGTHTSSRGGYASSSAPYDAYPGAYSSTSASYSPDYATMGGQIAYGGGGQRPSGRGPPSTPNPDPVILDQNRRAQCWDHGCNGRTFSTHSNLMRHQREKSGISNKAQCPLCGAEFTRKTARDGHVANHKCKDRRKS